MSPRISPTVVMRIFITMYLPLMPILARRRVCGQSRWGGARVSRVHLRDRYSARRMTPTLDGSAPLRPKFAPSCSQDNIF
jgi:hypothetical protein